MTEITPTIHFSRIARKSPQKKQAIRRSNAPAVGYVLKPRKKTEPEYLKEARRIVTEEFKRAGIPANKRPHVTFKLLDKARDLISYSPRQHTITIWVTPEAYFENRFKGIEPTPQRVVHCFRRAMKHEADHAIRACIIRQFFTRNPLPAWKKLLIGYVESLGYKIARLTHPVINDNKQFQETADRVQTILASGQTPTPEDFKDTTAAKNPHGEFIQGAIQNALRGVGSRQVSSRQWQLNERDALAFTHALASDLIGSRHTESWLYSFAPTELAANEVMNTVPIPFKDSTYVEAVKAIDDSHRRRRELYQVLTQRVTDAEQGTNLPGIQVEINDNKRDLGFFNDVETYLRGLPDKKSKLTVPEWCKT